MRRRSVLSRACPACHELIRELQAENRQLTREIRRLGDDFTRSQIGWLKRWWRALPEERRRRIDRTVERAVFEVQVANERHRLDPLRYPLAPKQKGRPSREDDRPESDLMANEVDRCTRR